MSISYDNKSNNTAKITPSTKSTEARKVSPTLKNENAFASIKPPSTGIKVAWNAFGTITDTFDKFARATQDTMGVEIGARHVTASARAKNNPELLEQNKDIQNRLRTAAEKLGVKTDDLNLKVDGFFGTSYQTLATRLAATPEINYTSKFSSHNPMISRDGKNEIKVGYNGDFSIAAGFLTSIYKYSE